jgi:DNA-binding response OmpR family regulator
MKKKAWVVDDDEKIRQAMELMLKIMGYDVEAFSEARTPSRALMGGGRPDILFLDIRMPQVSGIEMLRFVRSRETLKYLTVVMCTAESDEVMVEDIMRIGADGYVFKPVNFDELENAVRTSIERHRVVLGVQDNTTKAV